MKIKNGRQKGTSILLLCLFALSPLLFVAPVKGQSTVLIEECEPMLEVWVENQSASQPYIAAYMTTDYIEANPGGGPNAKAVRVTVSFSGTDKFVIQSDNWLTAGIAAQGPDSVHGGVNAIDWGYTFELMLVPWMHSDPFVHAEVFEGHEWVNGLPGYGKSIYCWNAIVPDLTVSSSVTLTMEWTEDTLDYYAKVGETNYLLFSYTPNETASHYFMTGTVGRSFGELPLPNTVKWLQFPGAWSNYNIGEVGWHSYLSYHGFIEAGGSSWTDVSFAYSTDGPNSYWDNTLGWGGDPYEGVDANYCYKYVHFYPTSNGTTLEPDTLLWAPPTCAMKTKNDGYFYVPNVATDLLKIEMLFDSQNVVGDQTGGASPYGSIAAYPDGKVNILDCMLVSNKFGLKEDGSGWDYMADVVPDRKINILDSMAVSRNFGKSGTYITDLAGAAITFNTGQTVSPESDGFVTIPPGATGFTVKRNGTPIGAMVIFW